MKRYTVMLCCNDQHGMLTGGVEEVAIENEIRLERSRTVPALRFEPEFIKVGRVRFDCSRHQTWVGNVFWDAVGMDEVAAQRLVEHLLSLGWTVVEHACEGLFAEYARKAVW
jgi:hypothetical protein